MTMTMEALSDDDNNDNNALEGGVRHAVSSSKGRGCWQEEENRQTMDIRQPPQGGNINIIQSVMMT
jgi:hypothetical protein